MMEGHGQSSTDSRRSVILGISRSGQRGPAGAFTRSVSKVGCDVGRKGD